MPDAEILAWLKAKARVIDAEDQLSNILDDAEQLVKKFRDRPTSEDFDPNSWPSGAGIAAALQEYREAEREFDEANAVLSPLDRKLLKSVPES